MSARDRCVYCYDQVSDIADASKHHAENHENLRFDPLWYSAASDWEQANINDISELQRLVNTDTDHPEEQ
jgi:hypothetical protein